MQKQTHDYDNVFKTMKSKHKRLFVAVINDIFGKCYPMDVRVDVLPSEGYLTESETADGRKEIEEQISDFLIRIGSEVYLLECQLVNINTQSFRRSHRTASCQYNVPYRVDKFKSSFPEIRQVKVPIPSEMDR